MRFKVERLEQLSTAELRDRFSSIPKKVHRIVLSGSFIDISEVPNELAYLPKHITEVNFRVEFCYRTETKHLPSHERNIHGIEVPGRAYTENIQTLGAGLKFYVESLPKTINAIYFTFIDMNTRMDATQVPYGIAEMLEKISPHIHTLSLHNPSRSDLSARSLHSIPKTVKRLMISQGHLGHQRFPVVGAKILSTLKPTIEHLSLVNNDLYQLNADSLSRFARFLPAGLSSLDLGYNALNRKSIDDLMLLFTSLASLQFLKMLGLSGNQLSMLSVGDLARVFSFLPTTIHGLDLGDNGFLLLDNPSFKAIMDSLPKTINALRLCENGRTVIARQRLEQRLHSLPAQINSLSFSGSNLLNLSIEDFVAVLATLPRTIDTLDLSNNNLGKRPIQELRVLFANLPPTLRNLKLGYNALNQLTVANLQSLLALLPPSIDEITLTGNGFDRIPASQVRQVFESVPSSVRKVITGYDAFKLSDEGALVPAVGFFQGKNLDAQKSFISQQEFAKLRIVLMQLVLESGLSYDVLSHIFSYVFIKAPPHELKRMEAAFKTLLISSVPPEEITEEHQEQCLDAVEQRIRNRKPSEKVLDLSRCGLNRLTSEWSQDRLINGLDKLPKGVIWLKLRSNGFLYQDRNQEVFRQLMPRIPENITHLDLSDNRLEYQSAETLTELFAYLPQHIVSVILDHGEALSPAVHIAKRNWPESYYELTRHTSNKLLQASILLNDYTKWDSAFWQFLYGHWGRTNTEQAAKISHSLDKKAIKSEDLDEELTQVKPANPMGSYAKRICFLTYHQPRPDAAVGVGNSNENPEAIELDELGESCCSYY